MKKLIYLGVATIMLAALGFVSCEKENPVYTNNLLVESENSGTNTIIEKADDTWWEKVKKWVKSHSGTYLFNNCNNNLPCGPCTGFCSNAGIVGGSDNDGLDELTVSEREQGQGLGAWLVEIDQNGNDSLRLKISFNNESERFLIDDQLILDEDKILSEELCEVLNVSSLTLKSGEYDFSIDKETGYKSSFVNAVIKM